MDVKTPHRGRLFSVDVMSWTSEAGHRISREVARHPGAVLIVPELPGDRLVMIRNYRVAVDEQLWELPAGTREPDEPAIDTARREVEEETGYRPGHIEPLGEFYTSPGFCDEHMSVFVAADLEHVGQKLEPHEAIEVVELPRDEVFAMIDDGRIVDGKTIAALLLWSRRPS